MPNQHLPKQALPILLKEIVDFLDTTKNTRTTIRTTMASVNERQTVFRQSGEFFLGCSLMNKVVRCLRFQVRKINNNLEHRYRTSLPDEPRREEPVHVKIEA